MRDAPCLVSTLSICYTNLLFEAAKPSFSLIRRLLASSLHAVIESYPSRDRVHAIALDCHSNQRMAMFDDVLNETSLRSSR